MTIDQVKKLFDLICNNYEKGGNVNGTEFSILFNTFQTNYYDFLLGHVEQFQPGRPVPRVGVGMGEGVMTRLSPFIQTSASTIVTSGQATKPPGFGRLLAMRTASDDQVDRVEHDKAAARIKSVVIPAETNPFYIEYAAYWLVYPASTASVKIDWLPSKPTDANWGFSDSSGREIYDAGASTHPLWNDYDIYAIVARMVKAMGVTVDDGMVVQFAQSVIQSGE